MLSAGETLQALEWLVEIGADEAIGDRAGLIHWQGKAAAVSVERVAAPVPPIQRPKGLAAVPASAPSAAHPDFPAELKPVSHPVSVNAPSLEALRAELEALDGLAIKSTAMNLVFASGNPKAKIMIIGDVPGEEEDRQGQPFVGPAGQLLDRMLAAIGLTRDDVYLTNLVFWRPPGGRTPSDVEVEACLPFTRQHIHLIRPEFLVVMGSTTVKALLRSKDSFAKVRGRWHDYAPVLAEESSPPIRCLPVYHPSHLLRQPALKRQTWADLQALMKEINNLSN